MDRTELRDEICADLQRRLRHPIPLEECATPLEIGLDSADVLEVIADIEDRHDIVIRLDELQSVRTLGQMIDHIHARIAP